MCIYIYIYICTAAWTPLHLCLFVIPAIFLFEMIV